MKKTYIAPKLQVIETELSNILLTGSNTSVSDAFDSPATENITSDAQERFDEAFDADWDF